MIPTYPLDRIVEFLFVLVYCVRYGPEEAQPAAFDLGLICVLAYLASLLLAAAPLVVRGSMTSCLFFVLHGLNIVNEHAKAENLDPRGRHTKRVPLLYAVLLCVIAALYLAATSLGRVDLPTRNMRAYYEDDTGHDTVP